MGAETSVSYSKTYLE